MLVTLQIAKNLKDEADWLYLGKEEERVNKLSTQNRGSRKQNKGDTKAGVMLILCVSYTGATRFPDSSGCF